MLLEWAPPGEDYVAYVDDVVYEHSFTEDPQGSTVLDCKGFPKREPYEGSKKLSFPRIMLERMMKCMDGAPAGLPEGCNGAVRLCAETVDYNEETGELMFFNPDRQTRWILVGDRDPGEVRYDPGA